MGFRFWKKKTPLSEDAALWNRFLEEICSRDISRLSPVQKTAVLAFWYDAEMQSGGHEGYFSLYPSCDYACLIEALWALDAGDMAENFLEALRTGRADDYQRADDRYDSFRLSLCS